ncbi:RNA 3'-terminal phosphate cyclase [Diachasma alloeum]|uniref:RNA 3'-terminal phosphate cyclase n=1 Tax=Diachasma alloeum TaxID=454923 RepID=UPI0007384DB7|nr:RNA 3'-terminal phosphate cyclase [Diachasma alloeum]XP_015115557.1 RNA 3'-terminal phosphate cyclase [Diachasma alloeum]
MFKLFTIMSNVVKIDGSLGEGGGQVLRIALCLSALYKIPVEIDNIRAGRAKPGLAAQHLKGVEIARDMCNAKIKGAYVGSTRLEFHPESLSKTGKREFYADTQTAGCIALLAQVAVPIALFLPAGNRPVVLTLKGGTNVPMGPHIEFFTEVFKPWLNKFGGDFDFTVVRRGYYPKGGGEVNLRIKPIKNLKPIEVINQGNIKGISGWAYVAGSVHLNAAYQMAEEVKDFLSKELEKNEIEVPPINIEGYREDRNMAVGNGSGINVVCQTDTGCVFGGSGLGSNRDATNPPQEAVEQIMNPIINRSCVDAHMQDQLILLMALARGTSKVSIGSQKVTQHTETAIEIAKIMLKDRGLNFELKNCNETDPKGFVLECNGCGLTNDT